ncbi:VIP36-like protein [Protopterus annectens]|uniref:VIP36-like protein n=1 Tax=Protopterus annectens TaxID=7888 RepID=UPI001CFB1BD0|nr:VIP36-like protein [Protopterus annectens]
MVAIKFVARFQSVEMLRVLLILVALWLHCNHADQMEEFLKKEFSLMKPYAGLSSRSSNWDILGNTVLTTQSLRLTPEKQSKLGAVWNRVPCNVKDWELQVHFKIHGEAKTFMNGDGMAIWYTKDRMKKGPVFGSKDMFVGLGVFLDTYPNEDKQDELLSKRFTPRTERVFPYISAMINNGSLSYDHDNDGRPSELAGCSASIRNVKHDTFLVIRYVKSRLTIMMDIEGKNEWKDCVDVAGVRLPQGFYFGVSALTGDLSDIHELISLKFYELTVERTRTLKEVEEPEENVEVTEPSVDNWTPPGKKVKPEPLDGLTVFLVAFFTLMTITGIAVAGILLCEKWEKRKESKRHFY